MTTEVPLLTAKGLRIDVDGAVLLERATFETKGQSAAILGDGYGLLAAIAGQGIIRAGSLRLAGWDIERREQFEGRERVGLAPHDPPLPAKTTVFQYLVWGARLAGLGRGAKRAADKALADLQMTDIAGAMVDTLGPAARRAVGLAQAIVGEPAVLVVSAPLSGLAGEDAAYVERAFAAACRGRRWLATIGNVYVGSAEHVLATRADHLIVFAGGQFVRVDSLRRIEQGATGYTLMMQGNSRALIEALRTRGIELSGGPARYWLDLPPTMTTADVLALSLETGTAIVELSPRLMFRAPTVVQEDLTP